MYKFSDNSKTNALLAIILAIIVIHTLFDVIFRLKV